MAARERGQKKGIVFLADYPPRQCGIATFTHDLCRAVAAHGQDRFDCGVIAVNDVPEGYRYDRTVRFEVRQAVQADYLQAADYVNISQTAVVCLQHEYGIFGGPAGAHVLGLLQRLRRPVVSTLHTVLREPDEEQRRVLKEICRLSARVVVMARRAEEFLRDVYGVPAEKIVHIPHGIPDVPFVDPSFYKDKFAVEGRLVILTFGLLGPGKGIEYAIAALPKVVARHPEAAYIILGATHPHIRRHSGEEYRTGLQRLAHELGVEEHVFFHNRFVEAEELCEFLCAADIYVTPYISETQMVSGTLAYAMGTGNAIVSTPYWYAQEMLAEDRGVLVPFRDSDAVAEQLLELLANGVRRDAMRKRAYQFARRMVWPEAGRQYLELFEQVRHTPILTAAPALAAGARAMELPEPDLRHLRTLTDDTGILQHALFTTPDRRFGYCTDDNARALIVAAMHWRQTGDRGVLDLLHRYLAFVAHAQDGQTGRFRNFMNYDRTWSEKPPSEDAHARALWGLGLCVAYCRQESATALATRLFERGLAPLEQFASPRAWAYGVVGIHAYLRRFSGDSNARRLRAVLAERIHRHFADHVSDDWPWCEDVVTYANAKLPHALLMSGKWMERPEMVQMGERTLRWLLEVQTGSRGQLSLVGTEGWFPRGGRKAMFDQQPIEAHALVEACVEAYSVTGQEFWLQQARRCFNWFLGNNDIRAPLYDFNTGGCRDGIHPDRVNQNQGAESALAWLMSLMLMHEVQARQALAQPAEAAAGAAADQAPAARR